MFVHLWLRAPLALCLALVSQEGGWLHLTAARR
jgi:hypothetical protein